MIIHWSMKNILKKKYLNPKKKNAIYNNYYSQYSSNNTSYNSDFGEDLNELELAKQLSLLDAKNDTTTTNEVVSTTGDDKPQNHDEFEMDEDLRLAIELSKKDM